MSITVDLEALKTARRAIEGRYLQIISATGSFEITAMGIAPIPAIVGQALVLPEGIDTIVFRDTSGNANSLVVEDSIVPSARPDSSQVAISNQPTVHIGSAVTIAQQNESPDTPDLTIPAGTTVKIHDPAVYACEIVEFYAGEANTLNLRVWPGGDGTTVQGGILQPGGGGEYSGALIIWAHNAGATDQTINLTKLKRV